MPLIFPEANLTVILPPYITTLDVSSNAADSRGLSVVRNLLRTATYLINLSTKTMNTDLSSFRHFCFSMPHYRWASFFVEVILGPNNLGNEGIRMLSFYPFPHLPSLQRLWLQETVFDNGGILSLAAGFPLFRNLELLAVSHNKITVAGLTAVSFLSRRFGCPSCYPWTRSWFNRLSYSPCTLSWAVLAQRALRAAPLLLAGWIEPLFLCLQSFDDAQTT